MIEMGILEIPPRSTRSALQAAAFGCSLDDTLPEAMIAAVPEGQAAMH